MLRARIAQFAIYSAAMSAVVAVSLFLLLSPRVQYCPDVCDPTEGCPASCQDRYAGRVGEYVASVVPLGSAVALTTTTARTVTSISLTAGDWDVSALGYVAPAATTNVTQVGASISGTTNTLDLTVGRAAFTSFPAFVPGAVGLATTIPPHRMSLSATTTVFLVAQATFSGSTASAFGMIRARRMR